MIDYVISFLSSNYDIVHSNKNILNCQKTLFLGFSEKPVHWKWSSVGFQCQNWRRLSELCLENDENWLSWVEFYNRRSLTRGEKHVSSWEAGNWSFLCWEESCRLRPFCFEVMLKFLITWWLAALCQSYSPGWNHSAVDGLWCVNGFCFVIK